MAIYTGKGDFSRIYRIIEENILKSIYQFNDTEQMLGRTPRLWIKDGLKYVKKDPLPVANSQC